MKAKQGRGVGTKRSEVVSDECWVDARPADGPIEVHGRHDVEVENVQVLHHAGVFLRKLDALTQGGVGGQGRGLGSNGGNFQWISY